MFDFKRFLVTISAHIAHVRFNRPQKANALDEIGWQELRQLFEQLDQMDEVRVVVLSGEGKQFCAGADQSFLMGAFSKLQDESKGHASERLHQLVLELQASVNVIECCRKPVLATIHGACVGGGVDIVTACDMRYVTSDAFFAISEIDLGIVADLGTLQRLPKIIPQGIARELAYTGGRLPAEKALAIGLVNKVYVDKGAMLAGVMEIAAQIAGKSPLAIRGSKQVLNYSRDHSVAEGLAQVAWWNAGMLINQDLTEAFTAKMAKREPDFRG